jgi:phospholipid/cholesterol/gamma-HCH transport system substrate-binding protein
MSFMAQKAAGSVTVQDAGTLLRAAAAGMATVAVLVGAVALCFTMFRGGLVDTVPVTVLSPRAGLVMDPDAKVKMHGVQVGTVTSIEEQPGGQVAIHLAMNRGGLRRIPKNALVDIASSTFFGGKFVQLLDPPDPSPEPMHAGQILDAQHVTVEFNTVFEQLNAVLAKIGPTKLSETLGAIAAAFNGRGQKFGQALADLDSFLAKTQPSLGTLSHEISVAPAVVESYADAAPDLLDTVDHTNRISQTIVDEQHNLDALLISAIGLADLGTDVTGSNRQALTDVAHLLVPTTDLTNEYHEGITCSLVGGIPFVHLPPEPDPGIYVYGGSMLGVERYRYPANLPKVAAKGGPHCSDLLLPNVPFEGRPPYLVTDIGANPWQYGNQGLLANSDALKQFLFGPIDGPPRNTAQVGQPG